MGAGGLERPKNTKAIGIAATGIVVNINCRPRGMFCKNDAGPRCEAQRVTEPHCQPMTSITTSADASINVSVNARPSSRRIVTATAGALRPVVEAGSIQCARLINTNGRNSSHSARLAAPDVSPPQ